MVRLPLWAVLGLWFVGACCSTARAQEDSPGYRGLIEQALAEYGAKNYEEANALFTRAHELAPSARTLRGMGMTSFELRRYVECVEQLEGALKSGVKPLDPTLRSETEALLARARGFIATLQVSLQPSRATLLIDGNEVRAREGLKLPLGEHELEARLAGYLPSKRKLRILGGEALSVQLALSPEHEHEHEHTSKRAPTSARKRSWLWPSVSAAALVVVGGTVAGVLLATRDRERTELVALGSTNTPESAVLQLRSTP